MLHDLIIPRTKCRWTLAVGGESTQPNDIPWKKMKYFRSFLFNFEAQKKRNVRNRIKKIHFFRRSGNPNSLHWHVAIVSYSFSLAFTITWLGPALRRFVKAIAKRNMSSYWMLNHRRTLRARIHRRKKRIGRSFNQINQPDNQYCSLTELGTIQGIQAIHKLLVVFELMRKS